MRLQYLASEAVLPNAVMKDQCKGVVGPRDAEKDVLQEPGVLL